MRKFLKYGLRTISTLFLLGAYGVFGQSIVTGGIAGVVTDSSGAAVGGANLTLKSNATGETYTTTSSPNGDYTFALLKPDDYTLSLTKDGFAVPTDVSLRNVRG